MLGRIISVLLALILALPAGSQSRSGSSAVFDLSPAAAQAYSQMSQNNFKSAGFPKTRPGRVAVVSAPLIAEGIGGQEIGRTVPGIEERLYS